MPFFPALSTSVLLGAQIGAVAASLTGLAFAPPAQGLMLLVPVAPGAERAMVSHAIAAGARLVGRGPWGRSIVVEADAAAARALLRQGVLPLAAPPSACGAAAATAEAVPGRPA